MEFQMEFIMIVVLAACATVAIVAYKIGFVSALADMIS